jgi:magnesium chelatase family protein
LARAGEGEPSGAIRKRVEIARGRMIERQNKANARLQSGEMNTHCVLECGAAGILQQAVARLGLSARAYHRVLKVARTIADLAGSTQIVAAHVAEAIQYRMSSPATRP